MKRASIIAVCQAVSHGRMTALAFGIKAVACFMDRFEKVKRFEVESARILTAEPPRG